MPPVLAKALERTVESGLIPPEVPAFIEWLET
jgi:hypothetical protein